MRALVPILRLLNQAGVQYVVVGGLAVIAHGHARLTTDVDIVVVMTPENIETAVSALQAAGYRPRAPVDPMNLADPEIRREWIEQKFMTVLSFVNPSSPLISVDVFADPPIDAGELFDRATVMMIGDEPVPIACLDDLLSMKRLAGRPVDLSDIEALEEGRDRA